MAATRILISNILRSTQAVQQQWKHTPSLCATSIRYSSYQSSPPVRPLEEYPEVEVVQNAPEWKFVERLLPPAVIPKPVAKPEYPSGWKPQTAANADNLKYYVARTKNHMVPVYLETRFRGHRRITVVRRVQGDIWSLEKELSAIVRKARNGRVCATRVNEMSGQIHIHGDYVDVVREYLKENGF